MPLPIMDSGVVPKHYSPAYIFAAYLVSYIGAWTTMELLCRRTASRGFYNWFILSGSSLTMGAIAIWGMYFIGNRATVIGGGADPWQLVYSPAYTTMSFFIPVVVLFIAFAVIGTADDKMDYPRIILGGTLAGLGVCCMHYLGQAGISNYNCIYTVPHVIGAAVIAISVSIAALGVFSYFRSSWDIRWWSRVVSALILATAVSGTHWVAAVGTEYQPKNTDPQENKDYSRNNTCIGVIVLSISGCVILLLVALLGQRHIAHSKNRAQQIALAAAIFDIDGRVLVTSEGFLPNRKITNTYLERSLDDVFCICHPLFMWSFRTSYNWSSVRDLLPAMRAHIYKTGVKGLLGTNDANMMSDQGSPIKDYSIVFQDLFCTAAADLADNFHIPLENLGILYDDILSTGTAPVDTNKKKRRIDIEREAQALLHQNSGSGQLLFLAKQVNLREAYDLQCAGYRFAVPAAVIKNLAGSVLSGEKVMLERLEMVRNYVRVDRNLDSGVHVACFTIRASLIPGRGGFEILSRKDASNLLPTMQMPIDKLEEWQVQYLEKYSNLTLVATMKLLRKASVPSNPSEHERAFAKQFLSTIESLKDEIDDLFFNDATFISQPIEAPCRGLTENSPPGVATLLVFKIIVPLQSRAPGRKLDFVPVSFFKMQQFVYPNSPDHEVFARRTYREFAPVLGLDDVLPKMWKSKTPKRGLGRTLDFKSANDNEDRRTFVDELFAIVIATR